MSKYFLWMACNDFRFPGIAASAVDVLESVKVRVRLNLPVFFKRFCSSSRRRYFVRQWARGTIASKRGNVLVVYL